MDPIELLRASAVVAMAACLAAALIVLLKPLLIRYLLAEPNARSSHACATPQGAGVAVILALVLISAAAWLAWAPPAAIPSLAPVLAAALGLMVLGLADDARPLPVSLRFAAQTLAGLVMVYGLPESLRLFPGVLPLSRSGHCSCLAPCF